MKMRLIPATMVAVACLLPMHNLCAATAPNRANPLAAQAAKVHKIAFQLRNDSGAAMTVQAGETTLALTPGQVLDVKLPAGQSLVSAQTTPHYPEGTVLAVVGNQLAGNVLVFH